MSDVILYGSYASYYTAKVRSALRKKAIPFSERLPSDPRFRAEVRPASGSHRIPQVLLPDGRVVQDSVEILDELERLYPQVPAFPSTPCQRIFTHLMELLGSEGLVRLAWMHRWMFEENLQFVKLDFGRSFRPQGTDADLLHYGEVIAQRMMSYGLPESTAALRAELDEQYIRFLKLFEAHLQEHPYLLGGHPSAADYALMGALHAHMGRDPAGLRVMQNHAPRTFRWVEHMLVPDLHAPEFFDRPVTWCENDQVPESAMAILNFLAEEFGLPFVLGQMAFQQCMAQQQPAPGTVLFADHDQPTLAPQSVEFEGTDHSVKASLYGVWLTQRSHKYLALCDAEGRERVRQWAEKHAHKRLAHLLQAPGPYSLARVDNRLVIE